MFNLTNLITTCVLATGVATTTPVNNANNIPSIQAETITNEYELTLNESETTNTTYYLGHAEDENPNLNANANVRLYKTNYFHDTTNYINVLGTKYYQKVFGIYNGEWIDYYQNKNTLVDTNYSEYASSHLIVLQIDSYNYNLYTEMEMSLNLRIYTEQPMLNGKIWNSDKTYYQRIVYHDTRDNWSTYIDRQLNYSASPSQIKLDIENVNNNFYYTKRIDNIEMTNPTQTDTFAIGIEPKKTNYFIIMYTPLVEATVYDGNTYETDTTNKIIPQKTLEQEIGVPTISGTNVIPDANYEVIDIPGLMWEILTMPFAFVSQAFNLTLFPGTPYQLNISNLFLSIIAVAVFIWLISFFLKMKG